MKISVKVKTKAKEEKVEKIGENSFLVWVKETAEKGKANKAVSKALAKYFKEPQTSLRIVSGAGNKQKIIAIGQESRKA